MAAVQKEMVLYYNPDRTDNTGNSSKAARLKGVLVRMGVRIKNITPDQVSQKVGCLAGLPGFKEQEGREDAADVKEVAAPGEKAALGKETSPGGTLILEEEIMVLKNFSDKRLDELLGSLRRAGVPKVELKAVLTPANSQWTLLELYEELKKERDAMKKTAD